VQTVSKHLTIVLYGLTLSITGSDTKLNCPAKFTREESIDTIRRFMTDGFALEPVMHVIELAKRFPYNWQFTEAFSLFVSMAVT